MQICCLSVLEQDKSLPTPKSLLCMTLHNPHTHSTCQHRSKLVMKMYLHTVTVSKISAQFPQFSGKVMRWTVDSHIVSVNNSTCLCQVIQSAWLKLFIITVSFVPQVTATLVITYLNLQESIIEASPQCGWGRGFKALSEGEQCDISILCFWDVISCLFEDFIHTTKKQHAEL